MVRNFGLIAYLVLIFKAVHRSSIRPKNGAIHTNYVYMSRMDVACGTVILRLSIGSRPFILQSTVTRPQYIILNRILWSMKINAFPSVPGLLIGMRIIIIVTTAATNSTLLRDRQFALTWFAAPRKCDNYRDQRMPTSDLMVLSHRPVVSPRPHEKLETIP